MSYGVGGACWDSDGGRLIVAGSGGVDDSCRGGSLLRRRPQRAAHNTKVLGDPTYRRPEQIFVT